MSEKKPVNPEKPVEKKSFGGAKPAYGKPAYGKPGEKKSFGGAKPAYGKPAYGKPGEKKSFDGAKPAYGKPAYGKPGEKKSFDGAKPAYGKPAYGKPGEKKSFDGAKPAYGKPAYGKPGEKKPYGSGKPAGGFGKPAGPYGKPAGPRPAGPYGKPAPHPAAPAAPAMSSGARRVALEVLEDVLHNDAYAALSLDDRLQNVNLSQLDKRFCASLVYRTLENLIRIDYVLDQFLEDAAGLNTRVRDILRLSACQMLFHDRIPDNAIVDEAVKLTRNLGMEGLTGLTNAVLRSIIRNRETLKWPEPEEGARYISIMYSVPMWLAEKLIRAYGESKALEICSYRNQSHYTVIRPNLERMTDADLEAMLSRKVWEAEKGLVPHAYRVRKASEMARDADYLSGAFSIQGESSMLAAQALDVRRGWQVLDCCAAPGGKTAYLAEMMQGTGRVYAWDLHDHRVALIRAMMQRLRLENIRPAVRDATIIKEDLVNTMDAVLLDAPCSGLGVMDNKPDIKYRATPESVAELTATQWKLLNTCCQYVKRGGYLVYSTCSMLPEENGLQVRSFLNAHPEFRLEPLPASIDEKFRARYTEDGLQLLPSEDGIEGFYIARMRRVR